MSDACATSSQSGPVPQQDPPERSEAMIPQGRYPTHAYGILVDDACIRRRAMVVYKEMRGEDPAQMPPEAARKAVDSIIRFTVVSLGDDIYDAVVGLPRFKRNLILMCDVRGIYLFVFKDNSSHAALHAPVDPEDVKRAKRFLGLQRQVATWHKVSYALL